MWVVRALLQLVTRIAVAVLIAIVIAEVRALLDGGDTVHTFRVVLLLLGGLFLLLGASGTGSAANRRLGWGEVTAGRGGVVFRGFQPRPRESGKPGPQPLRNAREDRKPVLPASLATNFLYFNQDGIKRGRDAHVGKIF